MSRPEGGLAANLRTDLAWTLAIGGLSLLLHVLYAVQFGRHPLGEHEWLDESAYRSRGMEILDGHWLPSRVISRNPVFPYVLAPIMRLVGTDVPVLRLVLAILGSLTPVVVYWAGRRGLGRAEGALAGLALAVFGPLVFFDGLLEKEGLAALAAAMGLLCAAHTAGRHRALLWPALAGFAWGIVALLRANALLVALLGACWLLLAFRPGDSLRRVLRTLCFLAGFSLPLAPVIGVSSTSAEKWILLAATWRLGPSFYIGNGPEATGTYVAPAFLKAPPTLGADSFRLEAERRTRRPHLPLDASLYWFKEGLKQWRHEPVPSAWLLLRKTALVLNDFEIPDPHTLDVVRLVASPALGWCVLSLGWLVPWAAVGLSRSSRTPFWWFVALTTVAGLLSTTLFYVVGRYRIPWMPGLALLAASGAIELREQVSRRRWRGLFWRLVLLALPAALVAWWPIPELAPDRWEHAETELALAYLADYQLDQTIGALDDACALGPGPAGRVAELVASGPVHDRLARMISAEYSRESQFKPVAEILQARWLRQLPEGRVESRRLLEAAIREHPDDAEALRELGAWWLGELHDPDARLHAVAFLHRAAMGQAGDPVAANLLALAGRDSAPLDWPAGRRAVAPPSRTRLTRAIVASIERP